MGRESENRVEDRMKTREIEVFVSDAFISKLENGTLENVAPAKDKFYKNKATITVEEDEPFYKLTVSEINSLALDWFSDCGVPAQCEEFFTKKLKEMGKVGEIKK